MSTLEDVLKEFDETLKKRLFMSFPKFYGDREVYLVTDIKAFIRKAIEDAFEATACIKRIMRSEDCNCGSNPVCGACENMTGEEVGSIDGYNHALAEVKKLQTKYLGRGEDVLKNGHIGQLDEFKIYKPGKALLNGEVKDLKKTK